MAKLQKKEAELFRAAVECHDKKQYDKGLKLCETILKKAENHGETLAMKGLILSHSGPSKRDEAFELVKLGIKNDLKSSMVWHVYGILYRSEHNYKEAMKCFLNAQRFDPNNMNLQRDLSYLQLHIQDIGGFVRMRHAILMRQPSFRPNWIAYAIGNFMGEQYGVAHDIVERYYESVADTAKAGPNTMVVNGLTVPIGNKANTLDKGDEFEDSELLFFQNSCLERQQRYEDAIAHLNKHAKKITDKYSMRIKLAEYALLLGRFEEAKEKWMDLVLYQVDNYKLHIGLQCAYLQLSPAECLEMFRLKRLELPSTTLSLTTEQVATLTALYNSTNPKFLKSHIVTKIKFTFLPLEELKPELEKYVKHCLREGVPALYHDVYNLVRHVNPLHATNNNNNSNNGASAKKVLVTDPVDFRQHPLVQYLTPLLAEYIANLKQFQQFTVDKKDDKDNAESPSALLWTLFLYASLLEKSGQVKEALALIEECLQHTPTAIDMYIKKGKLLKKLLLLEEAAETVDTGRKLDLQDRYLNNKATKYILRNNEIERGVDTFALFVKHDGDVEKTIDYLQINWYQLELGAAYTRTKQFGTALFTYHKVLKNFKDYATDMFEYHSYASRRTTLRYYTELFQKITEVPSHRFFQRAAVAAIEIYLHLIDNPEDIDGLAHLPMKDRKRERERIKKQKAKDLEQYQKLKAEAVADGNNELKDELTAKWDKQQEISGEKFLTKPNLLSEVETTWCQMLLPVVKALDSETLAAVAEVYLRQSKFVQVLRCLHVGLAKDSLDPLLNVQLIKLAKKVHDLSSSSTTTTTTTKPMREGTLKVIQEELSLLLRGEEDISAFANQYIATIDSLHSLPHLLAKGKILLLLASHNKVSAVKQTVADLLSTFDNNNNQWRGFKAQVLLEIYKYLSTELKTEVQAEQFRLRCVGWFPGANAFETATTAATKTANGGEEETTAEKQQETA